MHISSMKGNMMKSEDRLEKNIAEALQNKENTQNINANGNTGTDIDKVDVFLSYSSLNKNVADAVVSNFEQHGIRCWYAPRDIMPGQEWVTAIHEAINTCKLFVLIYTDSSNESKQVANEVALAFNSGKTLIPFKLSDTEMSSELEYYLTRVHWLDAVKPPLMQSIESLREYSEKILKGNVPKESKVKNANGVRGRQISNAWLIPILAVLVIFLIIAIVLLVNNKDKPEKNPEPALVDNASVTPEPTETPKITATSTPKPTPTNSETDVLIVDGLEPEAMYKKAFQYQTVSRIEADYNRAYECYMKTGDYLTEDEEIIEAMNELAAYYYNDLDDAEKKAKALDLYNKAAACGSIRANNFLGGYYLDIDRDPDEVKYASGAYEGNGMTDALAKAIHYYEVSADKNDNIALYSLGYIYENSDGQNNLTHLSDNASYDYAKALDYYEKAVKAGHQSAQAAYDRVKNLMNNE